MDTHRLIKKYNEVTPVNQTKVSPEHITKIIEALTFEYERVGKTNVTGCWAFDSDGFKVGYGESACVDPENFDEELGKIYAKERAIADATGELWKMEGYMLAKTGKTSDRVIKDHDVREFVGELTEIARTYAGTQQLRSRISNQVLEFLGVNHG